MIKNFLLILRRNKVYGVLNMVGLSVGIACALLIFLWVEDEVTFNHRFKKRDHIYKVMMNRTEDGKTYMQPMTAPILGETIKRDIPDVANIVRLKNWTANISKDDIQTSESGYCCDHSFFSMFSVQFVHGNPENAFQNISSVVLSEKTSKKFFSDDNPVGKLLMFNNETFTVTAVVKEFPENTSLGFGFLIPFEVLVYQTQWWPVEFIQTNWTAYQVETIIELNPLANVEFVNKKMNDLLESNGSYWKNSYLFNMNDWRKYSSFDNGGQPVISELYKLVRLLSIISFIILLLACINFMNLETAKSVKRAKEVGVLKSVGVGRIILIRRFLGESMVQVFVSLVASIIIVMSVIPFFNQLVSKNLSFELLTPEHIISLIVLFLFCGFLSGLYPAFFLSTFKVVDTLKGLKLPSRKGVENVRKMLVVFQFSVSICLIVCILVIYGQFLHTRNRDWGYKEAGVVTIPINNAMLDNSMALLQEIKRLPAVENAGIAQDIFNCRYYTNRDLQWTGKDTEKSVYVLSGVEGVFTTMGIELVAGHDFGENEFLDSEHGSVIINQSLAQLMGEEGRIGGEIKLWETPYRITGIAKNHIFSNYSALHSEPLMMFCGKRQDWKYQLYIKVKDRKNVYTAIQSIEPLLQPYSADKTAAYTILEDRMNQIMRDERYMAKLLSGFCLMAVLISSFGLPGLAAFATAQRTREIGIRKIFGASVSQITLLVSKDFLKLAGISCIFAFPVAWWVMNRWLENYEYRISLYWWIFALAGLIVILIAWCTIGIQTISAATINPADAVKRE